MESRQKAVLQPLCLALGVRQPIPALGKSQLLLSPFMTLFEQVGRAAVPLSPFNDQSAL